mgnify:CR=1 FL=1
MTRIARRSGSSWRSPPPPHHEDRELYAKVGQHVPRPQGPPHRLLLCPDQLGHRAIDVDRVRPEALGRVDLGDEEVDHVDPLLRFLDDPVKFPPDLAVVEAGIQVVHKGG